MNNYVAQELEEFENNIVANMRFLRDHLEEIDQRNYNFVRSLCEYYETYDKLSPKQLQYAAKYFNEVKAASDDEPNYSQGRPAGNVGTVNTNIHNDKTSSEDVPRVIVNGIELIDRFTKAAETLKYPKINYFMDDGTEICLYRQGMSAKDPGSIGVIHKRTESGRQEYLGKILNNKKSQNHGYLLWTSTIWGNPILQQLIKKIVEDFPAVLGENGRKHNTCCFCCRTLTHPESKEKGYGPICAGKYNLPWDNRDGSFSHVYEKGDC